MSGHGRLGRVASLAVWIASTSAATSIGVRGSRADAGSARDVVDDPWKDLPAAPEPTERSTRTKRSSDERRTVRASLSGSARSAFDDALELVRADNVEAALFKFKLAYELSGEPRLLYNIAACYARLKKYVAARASLRRYKDEAYAARTLTPEDLVETYKFLESYDSVIGRLRIDVDQPGAQIEVDGQELGKAPLGASLEIEEGERLVRVTLDGYRDWAGRAVIFGNGAETLVTVRLQRREGRLVVRTAPSEAVVRVDDKLGGVGRFDAVLPVGPHHVTVAADGMKARELDVSVVDGQTRSFEVALERQERPREGRTWWWVGGGLAVLGIAVVGVALIVTSARDPIPDTRPGTLGNNSMPLVRF